MRRAAREFRTQAIESSATEEEEGCDPLCYMTTPSASIALFRARDLQNGYLPNYSLTANRIFRRAMHGGRVETTQWMWKVPGQESNTETLRKVDINSLYPTVEVKYRYPIGYPDDLLGEPVPDRWPAELYPSHGQGPVRLSMDDDENDIHECLEWLLHEDRFAFLVVDVVPPTKLFTPVLCEKSGTIGIKTFNCSLCIRGPCCVVLILGRAHSYL